MLWIYISLTQYVDNSFSAFYLNFLPHVAAPVYLESVVHKVLKVNASREPWPLASCAHHRN